MGGFLCLGFFGGELGRFFCVWFFVGLVVSFFVLSLSFTIEEGSILV